MFPSLFTLAGRRDRHTFGCGDFFYWCSHQKEAWAPARKQKLSGQRFRYWTAYRIVGSRFILAFSKKLTGHGDLLDWTRLESWRTSRKPGQGGVFLAKVGRHHSTGGQRMDSNGADRWSRRPIHVCQWRNSTGNGPLAPRSSGNTSRNRAISWPKASHQMGCLLYTSPSPRDS